MHPAYNLPALPDEFFEQLKGMLKAEFVGCSTCQTPLCSCAGAHKAWVIFLPGERAWIERKYNQRFVGGDSLTAPICGDCVFLQGKCTLGAHKPFDDYSFPLQPTYNIAKGLLVPTFAKNCSVHPADVPLDWLTQVWAAWQFVLFWAPVDWLDFYSNIPPNWGAKDVSSEGEVVVRFDS